jgi:hypothetical protein
MVASFAQILKPSIFNSTNFKRWRDRMVLWLTAMNVFHIAWEKPETSETPEVEQTSMAANNLFRGIMISVLAESLVDIYISLQFAKQL